MITFDSDLCLTGQAPAGLSPVVWDVARDVTEEHLHDTLVTFFVPECAADLHDGGPISEPVCCGADLANAITDGGLRCERLVIDGTAVWVAPVNQCGYRADVLLFPESNWIPDDIRQALEYASRKGDDSDA